ncbi:MAG: RdgB/HAM1 family non-canonical purine NTP pyrophosphatase [Verrucomicrobiales bacterium]|nr:RdgB/HAM1 family non-canonical purine NTP pyrophosphatase [Verrucomicrobiales bacterium]
MPTLVVATGNAHKTGEIAVMLSGHFDEVLDLRAYPDLTPAEETGDTFEANAALKALAISTALPGALVLADDSGIEVDALDRRPGVYSARYAGPGATDADNRHKLLAELSDVGARGPARSARFRCALVLAQGGEVLATFDGSVEGVLTNQEKGSGGFGYDPLFIPEGHCETFGQLPESVKNQFSHRARAMARLREWLDARIA